MVYFVLAEDVQRVKIGQSDDVDKRVKALATASPVSLRLLGAIKEQTHSSEHSEYGIHRKWSSLRVKGEWFAASSELLAWIRQITKPKPATPAGLKRKCVRLENHGPSAEDFYFYSVKFRCNGAPDFLLCEQFEHRCLYTPEEIATVLGVGVDVVSGLIEYRMTSVSLITAKTPRFLPEYIYELIERVDSANTLAEFRSLIAAELEATA